MRVLFVSNPMMGHTLPLVPLATAMRDAGHDVAWATGADAHSTVEGAGAMPIEAGRTHAEWISEFTDRYPEVKDIPPATRGDFMFPRFFGELIAPVMLDDVCTIVDRWQPDLLVHESAELSTPIVAAACSIPKATQSVGAPPPLTRIEAASNAVEPLWRDLDLTPPPWAGTFDPVHLDIYPPTMRPSYAATLPPALPLRPASHASSNGNDAALELPPGDAPLVYVTFGTVFNTARATLSSVIEAVAALDVRVLVTIGSTVDPATFGDQPRNVRVERFIPQDAVLRFASVVVSHAGSGTTLGALRHGVPQLCLPQGADQFVNGEQVQLADAGLTLKPNDANEHEVARAVQRLLAEPTFAAGASRIREEIDSMPSPADVVADLERFVAR